MWSCLIASRFQPFPHISHPFSFTPRGSSFDLNGLKKFSGWVYYLFLPLWILLENVAQDKNPCESSSYIFWPWIFGVILSFSLFILKIHIIFEVYPWKVTFWLFFNKCNFWHFSQSLQILLSDAIKDFVLFCLLIKSDCVRSPIFWYI